MNKSVVPCYFLALLLFGAWCSSAYAAGERLGKTLLARGSVTADRAGAATALKRLSPVFRQDVLRSGSNARAQFRMIDDAYLNLQENSVLRLEKYQVKPGTQEGNVVMELISGGLRTITGAVGKQNKQDYQLKTPVATIGIRGTMYEVEIVAEGMYVAAWEGQIWIRSYSGKCDLTLGEGQPHRYALVNNDGECRTQNAVPTVFRDGHSSDIGRVIALADTEIEPLLDNPRRENYAFAAVLVGFQDIDLAVAQADRLTQGTPLFLTDQGIASALADASVTDFEQNIAGYLLSWGRWSDYSLQPDGSENASEVNDDNGLVWASYQPTNTDIVMNRQGSVRYDNMVASLAQSSMGPVSNVAVQMDVDFDSGLVTNGIVSANVPEYFWAGAFSGEVQQGELSLDFIGGSLVNSDTGAIAATQGNINGDFVGNDAQGVAGGFSMIDTTNDANQIEGVFLVEQ